MKCCFFNLKNVDIIFNNHLKCLIKEKEYDKKIMQNIVNTTYCEINFLGLCLVSVFTYQTIA